MRCINCNKVIPNTASVCPYCKKDPNMADDVSLGKIKDDVYNDKLDIKVFIKDKKNHKLIFMFGGLTIFVLVIIIFLIAFSLKSTSTSAYQIYASYINNVAESLEDTIENVKSGKYDLDITANNNNFIFQGNYSYDLANRIISLDGTLEDPVKKQGGVILETKDFNFEALVNEVNMYFKSDQIYDQTLYLPLDNISLYLNKKVDYTSIINSINYAMRASFKSMKYNISNDKYTYNGKNINVKKTELIINNKTKYTFFKTLYSELIDDSSFLSELAKITTKNEDELITILENYIDNYKHESDEKSDDISLFVYSKGKKIYEINYNNKIIYNVSGDKYYLKYVDKDNNELKLMIGTTSEDHQDYIEYVHDFSYSYKNNNLNGTLKLKEDIDSKIIKKEFNEYTNVNDLDQEKITSIKNNLNYYFKTNSFVDNLLEFTSVRCQKNLDCTCNDDKTCICLYNNKMISCNYDLVK